MRPSRHGCPRRPSPTDTVVPAATPPPGTGRARDRPASRRRWVRTANCGRTGSSTCRRLGEQVADGCRRSAFDHPGSGEARLLGRLPVVVSGRPTGRHHIGYVLAGMLAAALGVAGCTGSGTAITTPFATTAPVLQHGPTYEVKIEQI